MKTAIILIYRPEVDDGKSRFSGIEIFATEESTNGRLEENNFDDIIKPAEKDYPTAQFHIMHLP